MRRRTDDVYDVAVVGAGPAGASAALAALGAAPSLRVALIDPSHFPRDKTCGDGIAAEASDELAALGVPAGAVGGYEPVHRLRVRSPSGGTAARSMPRPVATVPRLVFDDRIRTAALGAGATPVTARVRAVDVASDGVRLRLSPGDGTPSARELRAVVVVAADGAQSAVRRAIGLPRNPEEHLAVAVRGYAPVAADAPHEQSIDMVRAGWPAYVWRFPVGDGSSNVGYGCRRDRLADQGRAGLHDVLAAQLDGPAPDPATLRAAHLPLSTWRPRQPDGPVLLAGDAASLVNPLTGEGIYYAVVSGRLAGEAAASHCSGAAGAVYRSALQRRLGRHLLHTTVLARLTASERFLDAVLDACARDAAAFDAVVHLGLGEGRVDGPLARSVVRSLVAGVRPRGRPRG